MDRICDLPNEHKTPEPRGKRYSLLTDKGT
jgi:hypothetical protein